METENLNQPANNPIETLVQSQPQPAANSLMSPKKFLSLIFVILILLLVVIGGNYYLGMKKNNVNQAPPSPTQAAVYVSPTPANVSWKTESVQIQKETAVSGNENITLSFQLPSNWVLKTTPKVTNPNNMIKNCADYVLTSADSMATLTVSPMCAGWSAEYIDWPTDSVILKEQQNVGADGHTSYTVRYLDNETNSYRYVEGEKGASNKVMDAIIITYNKSTGNFLPLNVALKYAGSDQDSILTITDRIITSLSAKTN